MANQDWKNRAEIKIARDSARHEFMKALWRAGYKNQQDLAEACGQKSNYVSKACRGDLPILRHDLMEYMKFHPKQ